MDETQIPQWSCILKPAFARTKTSQMPRVETICLVEQTETHPREDHFLINPFRDRYVL